MIDRPMAGKTGSSSANETESFIGFTPQLSIAGIAVNPDSPRDAVGAPVQKEIIEAVAKTMRDVLKGQEKKNFNAPSTKIAFKSGNPARPETAPAPEKTTAPGSGNNNGGGRNNNGPR